MSWPMVRLGDLGQWFGGGTPSKSRAEYWSNGTVPWLSPKDMGSDVLTGTQDRITEAAVRNSAVRLVPAGSVAVVMRSGILERTLPVAVVPFATTLNQDMKALSPRTGVDARWVGWALRSIEHRVFREARKAGTTVASIEATRLMDQRIPLPDEGEQRCIVAILEEHLSDLDGGSRTLVSAEAKSVTLIASARRSAVARGRELGGESTIGGRATLVEYGSSQKAHESPTEGDIPVLRMGNIQGGRLDFTSLKYLSSSTAGVPGLILKRGDLLFNRTNSAELVGKSAVYDSEMEATFASYLIRVRFDSAIRPNWANIVVNSPQGRAYIATIASQQVGQANVNGTKLKAFPLPVPPLEVQEELIQAFNELEAAAERLRSQAVRGLTRAQSLRRALLAAAFSGRLTGHGSDTDVISEVAEEESA